MGQLYPERPKEPEQGIDAYIDYSAGMGQGMQASADVLDRLKSFLGGRQVTYYSVGATPEPQPIDINSPKANFVNLANFTERGSRLAGPLDRIRFASARTAVFITDFERVDDVNLKQLLAGAPGPHPIDASAWGQNAIREWLRSGNRLDIFARQYTKPDVWFDKTGKAATPNWVYILVFTPWGDAIAPERQRTSLLGFLLEEHARAQSETFQHFVVWADGVRIERRDDPSSGNANPNMLPETFATNPTTWVPHEYYEWIVPDLFAAIQNVPDKDTRILNGVKISVDIPILDTATLGIDVRDVTETLLNIDASTNSPPVRTDTNPETGKIDTLEAPVPLDPSLIRGQAAPNVFEMVYNAETKEVGIKLDPNFSGVGAPTTYRVAVVLKDVRAEMFEDPAGVLSLQYSKGYKISPLRESVQLAVRDIAAELQGKEVYVFYITMNP